MPSLSVATQSNTSYSPTYVPVIVVTGATSGIGEAIVKLFARIVNGRAHIILIGRNKKAADDIIASLPTNGNEGISNSTYEFIPCDVTSMENVHNLAQTLLARLTKVNFLVHSAGTFSVFSSRNETKEGIDVHLASRYYSRFALTNDLLPLLRNAKEAGEPASVLSILGAGMAKTIDLDNLGLKEGYWGWKAMVASLPYNDLMVAEFARRNPGIGFTHIFPGSVRTGMLEFSNPIARFLMWLFYPLVKLVTISKEDCAEHMLYALLDTDNGGMYRRNDKGDEIGMKNFPEGKDGADAQTILWEHSLKETRSVPT